MAERDGTVRIWDPLLRTWHWGLAAVVLAAYLSGDEAEQLHIVLGYVVVAMLVLRLVWGALGPRYARFASFVRSPGAIVRYLRGLVDGTAPRYLGHNPAGAAMIVALLVALATASLTGYLMTLPGKSSALEAVHEVAANLTLVLVAVHVTGVLVASLMHKENLVRAMITGRKAAPAPGDIT